MSEGEMHGPEPIPHGPVYFVYALIGVLGLLVMMWIVSML